MPAIMTVGREFYSCRKVYHPTMTCNQFAVDKLRRAFLNSAKICFFASFLPLIARKKK